MPVVFWAVQRVMKLSYWSVLDQVELSGSARATSMGSTTESVVSGVSLRVPASRLPSLRMGPTHTSAWACSVSPVTLSTVSAMRSWYLPLMSPSSVGVVSVYSMRMESRSCSQPIHWDWRSLKLTELPSMSTVEVYLSCSRGSVSTMTECWYRAAVLSLMPVYCCMAS